MENSIKTKIIKINEDWFSKIDKEGLSKNTILNFCYLSEEEIIEGYSVFYQNEGMGLN